VLELTPERHAQELRDMWQGRALAHTRHTALGMVVLSVLSHNFDDGMPVMLRAVFPGFESITAPFLCTAAKVDKTGTIVADMVTRDGKIEKDTVIFRDELHMQSEFRRLSDDLRLNDADRQELFHSVKRWVVADRRLDPLMDPKDPDARRLVLH
jgi:hypothetical protein